MSKRVRIPPLPQPSDGDYMIEWGEDKAKCFTGARAYDDAFEFAKTLKPPYSVYRCYGWELVKAVYENA